MNIIKKIILVFLIAAALALAYTSAYLPFAKASKYINAVQAGQNIHSIDEFKQVFDSVFNFYSPIGNEEVVKFLSNDILTLISQSQATENISRIIIEYIEPRLIANNVRHMLTGARAYETFWRRYGGKEEDYKAAISYYERAYAIGPKLPPVLYGMLGLYYAHHDLDKAKNIAGEILKYWPNDDRVKNLGFPL